MGLRGFAGFLGQLDGGLFHGRASRPLSIHRRDLSGVGGAEDDSERGPSPGTRTLRDDGASVGFDDRTAYRQAQAQARTSFGTARSRLG